MSEKFIYVYNEQARDVLLKAGFCLMKSDERNGIYVFEAIDSLNQTQSFALSNVSYIPSDLLTF